MAAAVWFIPQLVELYHSPFFRSIRGTTLRIFLALTLIGYVLLSYWVLHNFAGRRIITIMQLNILSNKSDYRLRSKTLVSTTEAIKTNKKASTKAAKLYHPMKTSNTSASENITFTDSTPPANLTQQSDFTVSTYVIEYTISEDNDTFTTVTAADTNIDEQFGTNFNVTTIEYTSITPNKSIKLNTIKQISEIFKTSSTTKYTTTANAIIKMNASVHTGTTEMTNTDENFASTIEHKFMSAEVNRVKTNITKKTNESYGTSTIKNMRTISDLIATSVNSVSINTAEQPNVNANHTKTRTDVPTNIKKSIISDFVQLSNTSLIDRLIKITYQVRNDSELTSNKGKRLRRAKNESEVFQNVKAKGATTGPVTPKDDKSTAEKISQLNEELSSFKAYATFGAFLFTASCYGTLGAITNSTALLLGTIILLPFAGISCAMCIWKDSYLMPEKSSFMFKASSKIVEPFLKIILTVFIFCSIMLFFALRKDIIDGRAEIQGMRTKEEEEEEEKKENEPSDKKYEKPSYKKYKKPSDEKYEEFHEKDIRKSQNGSQITDSDIPKKSPKIERSRELPKKEIQNLKTKKILKKHKLLKKPAGEKPVIPAIKKLAKPPIRSPHKKHITPTTEKYEPPIRPARKRHVTPTSEKQESPIRRLRKRHVIPTAVKHKPSIRSPRKKHVTPTVEKHESPIRSPRRTRHVIPTAIKHKPSIRSPRQKRLIPPTVEMRESPIRSPRKKRVISTAVKRKSSSRLPYKSSGAVLDSSGRQHPKKLLKPPKILGSKEHRLPRNSKTPSRKISKMTEKVKLFKSKLLGKRGLGKKKQMTGKLEPGRKRFGTFARRRLAPSVHVPESSSSQESD